MIQIEFDNLINELVQVYGERSFPSAVKKRIWNYCQDMTKAQFHGAVTWAIDNLDKAPRISYFKTRTNLTPQLAPKGCPSCDEGRIYKTDTQRIGQPVVFRCFCEAGWHWSSDIPIWNESYAKRYQREKVEEQF